MKQLKYDRQNACRILDEADRTQEHQKPNIDKTKSHLNLYFGVKKGETFRERFLKKLNEKLNDPNDNTKQRKDLIVMDCISLTAPPEIKNDRQKCLEFFENAVDFQNKLTGTDNYICHAIHFDEATPHMHYYFIPVIKELKFAKDENGKKIIDKIEKSQDKNGKEKEKITYKKIATGKTKICNKESMNRQYLNTWHPLCQQYMNEHLPYQVSIETGITKKQGGNKDVSELRANTAMKEALVAKTVAEKATKEAELAKKELAEIKQLLISERKQNEITFKGSHNFRPKTLNHVFGEATVEVSKSNWSKLAKTFNAMSALCKTYKVLHIDELKQRLDSSNDKIKQLEESILEQEEQIALFKAKNNKLIQAIISNVKNLPLDIKNLDNKLSTIPTRQIRRPITFQTSQQKTKEEMEISRQQKEKERIKENPMVLTIYDMTCYINDMIANLPQNSDQLIKCNTLLLKLQGFQPDDILFSEQRIPTTSLQSKFFGSQTLQSLKSIIKGDEMYFLIEASNKQKMTYKAVRLGENIVNGKTAVYNISYGKKKEPTITKTEELAPLYRINNYKNAQTITKEYAKNEKEYMSNPNQRENYVRCIDLTRKLEKVANKMLDDGQPIRLNVHWNQDEYEETPKNEQERVEKELDYSWSL